VSNSTDHVWDDSDSNKPTQKVEKQPDSDEYVTYNAELAHDFEYISSDSESSWAKRAILDLAAERIGTRQVGYGRENAFKDIAERWKLWIFQRFGVELPLTPSDASDMLGEFKQARRLVRLRSGKTKRDDTVDQVGYIAWRDELEGGK
jgi:hypothetical protein